MEEKSLKEVLAGMRRYSSAEDVLSEIERLIETYRAAQEVVGQGTPLGQ